MGDFMFVVQFARRVGATVAASCVLAVTPHAVQAYTADQQQACFRADIAENSRARHRESRFIMKYTSGRISGRAHTMEAIANPS